MPRIKSLTNIVKDVGSQQNLMNSMKINPRNISVAYSEEDAQNLLSVLPDIKPAKAGSLSEKAKNKILKTRLQLQASARQAFKIALSANQIKKEEKSFAINNSLMMEELSEQQITRERESVLQKLRIFYKKNHKLIQKLNKAFNLFPLRRFRKSQDFGWILDNSQKSKKILSQPYTLMVNPTIIYGSEPQTKYEECASFPFIDCMIPRYNRLLVHYYNQQHKSNFICTQGFLSRVIQHHCEHLEGKTIIDWRINHGNMSINPSVQQYFPKSTSVVDDYSRSLKEIFKQFPELISLRQQYIIEPNQLDKLLTTIEESLTQTQETSKLIAKKKVMAQFEKNFNNYENHNTKFTINKTIMADLLPFEDDYVTRIIKHFKKQFSKFDQKVQLGLIKSQNINNQKTTNKNDIQTQKISESSYIEEIYSKQIKITYLHQKKQTTTKSQNLLQISTEQTYDISEEEIQKLLAKKKKGKKRK